MNKITLMDIMESLNSENTDDAAAALHEWFVDAARNVHAGLTGEAVVEDTDSDNLVDPEGINAAIRKYISEYLSDWDLEAGDSTAEEIEINFLPEVKFAFCAGGNIDPSVLADIKAESNDFFTLVVEQVEEQGIQCEVAFLQPWRWLTPNEQDIVDGRGHAGSIDYESMPDDMDESRVDELSRDAITQYAEKSGEDIERSKRMMAQAAERKGISVDDEYDSPGASGQFKRQMKRYSGLDDADYKLNGKARVPATEDEQLDELSRDTMMAYAKKARKDRDHAPEGDEDRVGRRIQGLDIVAHKARAEKAKLQYESEEVEEEQVEESVDDLIAELTEAFHGLETVSDKLQNVEGAQVGEEGKVPVNKKSTLPSKKGDKRVGGEAVEIKSNGHTGHALEKAPAVKDAPVKHHVQNSKDDPKKVGAEKGALLNKMDGSVNTQSPISGKGAKGLKK